MAVEKGVPVALTAPVTNSNLRLAISRDLVTAHWARSSVVESEAASETFTFFSLSGSR
jgi:hypothetical protein